MFPYVPVYLLRINDTGQHGILTIITSLIKIDFIVFGALLSLFPLVGVPISISQDVPFYVKFKC